jgi:hypothetical protein
MPSIRALSAQTAVLVLSLSPAMSLTQNAPRPTCPAAEVHRFDFLVGNWHGWEYNFVGGQRDSTRGDAVVAHNRKLPYGCGFAEQWEFTPADGSPAIESSILRSFDLASDSWRYTLVNNLVELATFESARSDAGWTFTHDIAGTTPPRRLEIEWMKTATGYTEVARVSTDSGRTWPIVRHLNYVRVADR